MKILWKRRRNCSLGAISPLFHNISHLLLDFHVSTGTRFSLRDKRLFEISEVEITRVDCIGFDSKRNAYMKVISYDHMMFYQYVNGKISSKKISMATKIA